MWRMRLKLSCMSPSMQRSIGTREAFSMIIQKWQ